MNRLGNAKKFFLSHREIKSSSSAIINIDNLLGKGINCCMNELTQLLRSCGDAVEYTEGTYHGVNPMDETVASNIKELCSMLSSHSNITYFDLYSKLRIENIDKQIKLTIDQVGLIYNADKQIYISSTLNLQVPYVTGAHPLKSLYILLIEILKGMCILIMHMSYVFIMYVIIMYVIIMYVIIMHAIIIYTV